MSSKLKKVLLSIAIVMVVLVIGLVAFIMLSGIATATVYDLRFVEEVEKPGETEEDEPTIQDVELFNKDVCLTATSENEFVVKLIISASANVDLEVFSSDNSIATITEQEDSFYLVKYFKSGLATITARAADNHDVHDSFTVNVSDYVPNTFAFDTESGNRNILGEREIVTYADELKYEYDFLVKEGTVVDNLNISSLYIVKNYDESLFKEIYIDDANQRLVIVTNNSSVDKTVALTIQSRVNGEEGQTFASFNFSVKIVGYRIDNVQIVVSSSTDFTNAIHVRGSGHLNDNEVSIQNVTLTREVNIIYVKIRVVYTNWTMEDVTDRSGSNTYGEIESVVRPENEDYYMIKINEVGGTIRFSEPSGKIESLNIIYISQGDSAYENFFNKDLYEKYVELDGTTYYRYKYWDSRFKRTDTITDEFGRIIGFIDEAPDCNTVYETQPVPGPEADE